jgi:hypothetical protein
MKKARLSIAAILGATAEDDSAMEPGAPAPIAV